MEFFQRKHIIGVMIIILIIIYIMQLVNIQLISSKYQFYAENNVLRHITRHPVRGLILDRNGKLIVCNTTAYDLEIVVNEISGFDTTEICEILNIEKNFLIEKINEIRTNKVKSVVKPYVIIKQIPANISSVLQEKLYKYKGFYLKTRTLRKYNKDISGQLFGYIAEVNQNILDNNDYYVVGDYIGRKGIELAYEEVLRGKKGVEIMIVDRQNRIKERYKDGKYDRKLKIGKNLTTTIDVEIQEYAEKLMQNKIGSVVAIEPSTGEILVLVSSPSYKPSKLIGKKIKKNYYKLLKDSNRPLYDRALLTGKYPPGSTFKCINALVALQEGVINEETKINCAGAYVSGRVRVGDHNSISPLTVEKAIQYSSNHFFCKLFRRTIDFNKFSSFEQGYNTWRNHVMSFGLGTKLNTDLNHIASGDIPPFDYYNKIYRKNSWSSLTVISLAIGQGEIGITPFQLANMSAIIANRGFYYIPHIVKKIEGESKIDEKFIKPIYTTIDREHFDVVINGMDLVVHGGAGSTARNAAIEDIKICGKTGTAQNPHGDDHSIFMAFAPKHNPKIAIAVYVENAGYGSTWASPIASLIIEKYINRKTDRKFLEERIINAKLIKSE